MNINDLPQELFELLLNGIMINSQYLIKCDDIHYKNTEKDIVKYVCMSNNKKLINMYNYLNNFTCLSEYMYHKLCNYCALQNNVKMLKWALKNKYYMNTSPRTYNPIWCEKCTNCNIPSIITMSLAFNKTKILRYLIEQLNIKIDSSLLHNIIRNNNTKMIKWVLVNGGEIKQNEINLIKKYVTTRSIIKLINNNYHIQKVDLFIITT